MIKFREDFEFSSANIEGSHHTQIVRDFDRKSITSFLRRKTENGMWVKLRRQKNYKT